MWIKNNRGALINLDTGRVIAIVRDGAGWECALQPARADEVEICLFYGTMSDAEEFMGRLCVVLGAKNV